ncbi:hypothetical protein HID58_085314, partial [Brassica napus]
MANSYTVLADLKAGGCSNTAEVRLLRFWEAKNINKRGQLMSVEMLLVDEHSTHIQGSVPAAIQLTFRGRLTEGSVYTLSGFDQPEIQTFYEDNCDRLSIRFNEETAFEKLATTTRIILTEHFRFRPYKQILELANTGKQLPYVMGDLRAIRSTITDRLPGAQRVMLTLRLEGIVNEEQGLYSPPVEGKNSKMFKSSNGHERPNRSPRQILCLQCSLLTFLPVSKHVFKWQTCAGAELLTNGMLWFIIYPFITSKDFSFDFLKWPFPFFDSSPPCAHLWYATQPHRSTFYFGYYATKNNIIKFNF